MSYGNQSCKKTENVLKSSTKNKNKNPHFPAWLPTHAIILAPSKKKVNAGAGERCYTMNFKEIKAHVYGLPIPTELLEPAAKSGYCCPVCSSGQGKNGTGATLFADDTRLQCFSCGRTFSALDIVAAVRCRIPVVGMKERYNDGDYADIIKECSDFFGLTLDERRSPAKSVADVKVPSTTSPHLVKSTSDVQEPAANKPEDTKEDNPPSIDKARTNLQKIVDAGAGDLTWRGLPLRLMTELGWGFLPEYRFHGKTTGSLFPSVVIPNVDGGVFARSVLTPPEGLPKGDNFAPADAPTLIHLPEDTDFTIFLTEGAINAASAFWAVQSVEGEKPKLAFLSTGSINYGAGFRRWLNEKYPNPAERPRVVVAFDNDLKDNGSNPGQTAARRLVDVLLDDGFAAANVILGGADGDLNDMLQREGSEKLGNMIINAVNDVQADFRAADEEIEVRKAIAAWEADNGKIEPSVLKQVRADSEYLQGVAEITAEIAGAAKTARAVAHCRYYDVFAQGANIFMARVAQAIAAATAAAKKSTPENPADLAIQALTLVKISQIEGKIDAATAQIHKAHEKYKKEYEEQQQRRQAAERESKRAEIRAKNQESAERQTKTTRSILPDCPIDLRFPTGFEFATDGSLLCSGELLITTPIVITKNLIGDDAEYAELAYRVGGTWRRRIVEKLVIADHRRIIELAAFGITVTSSSAKALSAFLARLIDFSNNDKIIPSQRLYDKPGWTDDGEFIYPSSDTAIVGGGIDYAKAFATSDDEKGVSIGYTPGGSQKMSVVNDWLEMYRRVVGYSTAARVIVGAALAAPLIKVINISNQWLHLVGDSGKGKSAVAKFAASIYGNPARLTTKFNSTGNALEAAALAMNDFPNFVEELQSAHKKAREEMDTAIYNFETGSVRGRCAKNGLIRPIKTFRGVRISTGEQTITREDSGEGAFKRVMELQCDTVLDNEFAVEVHKFAAEHYGLVGREWIEAIKGSAEEIRQTFNEYEQIFRRDAPTAFPNHVAFFAAIQTALLFFDSRVAKLGNFNEPAFRAAYKSDARKEAREVFASLPKKDSAGNAARAIGAVAEFISSHPYHFRWLVNDNEIAPSDKGEPSPAEIYGYKLKDKNYAVYPKALREILSDFPDARAIIRGFAQAGYLIDGNNDKRPFQKIVRVENKPTWFYVFKTTVLFPDKDSNDVSSEPEDVFGGSFDDDVPF